jgi:ATP-dependent Clp protease ATP-binding subunit ClpA
MDSATLTDNNGKKADFRNVILIMTTNAGARELSSGGVGFRNQSETKGQAKGAIERTFHARIPQSARRLGAVQGLDLENIKLIVDKFIKELKRAVSRKARSCKIGRNGERMAGEKRFRPEIRCASDGAVDSR